MDNHYKLVALEYGIFALSQILSITPHCHFIATFFSSSVVSSCKYMDICNLVEVLRNRA